MLFLSKCFSEIYKVILSAFLFLLCFKSQAIPADSVKVILTEGTNMAIALSPDKKSIVLDLQGTIWLLPIEGGKAKALTDALGDCRQPTWSADGNEIAFQSYRDGYFHIWKVNKDGTGLKQITSGIYHDREPHWSPDGKVIVFSSDRSGNYDIWKFDLQNGVLTQLTENSGNDYFPAWSADGTRIAYVSERATAAGIYIMETSGTHKLVVHSKEKLFSPAWHPDGNHVTFNILLPAASQLEFVKTGGGDWLTLSDSTEDVFPFKVSWLSDSTYLYTADGQIKQRRLGGKSAVSIPFQAEVTLVRHAYTAKKRNFDAGKPIPVQGIRSPVVSPDGNSIVFTALGDIWIHHKNKPVPRQITNDIFIEIDPVWSPDGKSIAFTSDRNGNMDIWIKNLATGKEILMLDASDNLKFPSWSPDGTKIAFYKADPKAYSRNVLNVINIKTRKTDTIYESLFEGSQPAWSPDGKYIVISALESYSTRFREGLSKFLIIPVGEIDVPFVETQTGAEFVSPQTGPRFVSPQTGRTLATRGKNGPVISPDGKTIAYIQDNVLWKVSVNQNLNIIGEPVKLTTELAEAPSWTGDSKSIVYLATDLLKKVNVESGNAESVKMQLNWNISEPNGQLVIHAGKVFDGKNEKYLENVDVIIEKSRISQILPHQPGRKGKFIDASQQTLIPGLFEMHTHQNAQLGEKGGRLWLAYGITSIREPGTDPYDALERKESWASGRRLGPRTFFTGGHMEGPRVYYNRSTSNIGGAQLDLELGRAVKLGYDLIKTYVGLPDSLQKVVTEFAHKSGIPVSSHEIYPAAGNGVDGVEHIGATSRRGYSPKLTAMNRTYQDVIELVAKSGMYITPTISLHGGFNALVKTDSSFFDHWQYAVFYTGKQKNALKSATSRAGEVNGTYKYVENSLIALIRKGARVTPGTDSPIIPSGLSYHAELQSWVKAGLSPFETLRAATLWSAEEIGVSKDLGTIETGKLADMVIINGDPLKNIKDVLNVTGVIRNGNYIGKDQLKGKN